jgi:hypothetical protein
MEQTDKNVLMDMALQLDLASLTNLCKTSKKMNQTLCNNDVFWMKKLYKDYPITIGKIGTKLSSPIFKTIYKSLVKKEIYIYHVFKSDCNAVDEPPKFWDYMKKGRKYFSDPMSEEDYDVAEKLYPDFNERCGEDFSFEMIGDFPKGTKIWLPYTSEMELKFTKAFLSKEQAINEIVDILGMILRDYYEYDREELEEHYGKTIEEFYGNRTKEESLKYFTQELNEKGKIKFLDMRTDTNEWYIIREFTIANHTDVLNI